MLAMTSIEIRVFKGAIPRCEDQPASRNNMPISGRAGAAQSACVTHRDGFRRNTAMVRKISRLTAISPLLRPVRGLMNCTALLAANAPKVVDCTQAQALH